MNVLSLFDGCSCGQVALERAGIKYDHYYASEIDKYAIKITQKNYPNTIQLGDVENLDISELPEIDLLIGGSPCQGFSNAGKRLNFDDKRSKLFFEYVRIMKELKPKWFLLENVKMKKEWQDIISEYIGVQPIEINSATVSAQNRKRLYWTNIPQGLLIDKGIKLKDILEYGIVDRDKSYCIDANYFKGGSLKNYIDKKRRQIVFGDKIKHSQSENRLYEIVMPANTKKGYIVAYHGDGVRHDFPTSTTGRGRSIKGLANTLMTGGNGGVNDNGVIRKLTPIECERLQTLPDNYTDGVSNTQRYKMLGNGWTVDVIAHIFKGIE